MPTSALVSHPQINKKILVGSASCLPHCVYDGQPKHFTIFGMDIDPLFGSTDDSDPPFLP
jgi:hypothetical protein